MPTHCSLVAIRPGIVSGTGTLSCPGLLQLYREPVVTPMSRDQGAETRRQEPTAHPKGGPLGWVSSPSNLHPWERLGVTYVIRLSEKTSRSGSSCFCKPNSRVSPHAKEGAGLHRASNGARKVTYECRVDALSPWLLK